VTANVEAFDAKLEAMKRSSKVDFGLWGGLVPGNLDQLEPLVRRGVTGFKAFMCPSGIDEFPASDLTTLREGMKRIAALGSILLVHAEDPARLLEPRGTGALDFIRSRPPEAEWSAINQAVDLAAATGCRLHVVHVSTARGLNLIREAQEKGVDVSGETCPHYLLYVEDDLERIGGVAKCAPPFRTAADREALWTAPMIVSDHSPAAPDLKQGDDFVKIWGGIAGCQSTRQLLLASDRLEPAQVAAATATNIASRFGLAAKGDIAAGNDADLWLVELRWRGTVQAADLLYANAFSAHEGQPIRGRTVGTLVRGQSVFATGKPSTAPIGRLVRPLQGGDSPH
jgi:allantoinase